MTAKITVNTFEADLRPMTRDDLQILHELTVSVFWPHRPADLEMLFGLGAGYIAQDILNRPLAVGLHYKMGPDFATHGMMVVPPRLHHHGAGSVILEALLEDVAGRDLRLFSTKQGYRLYERAGFMPRGKIFEHQGKVRGIRAPDPVSGLQVAPMEPEDFAEMASLDAAAFGADRRHVLQTLIGPARAEVRIGRVGVRLCGFAMCRQFGNGLAIGPVVAESEPMAMAITAPFLTAHVGKFIRIDIPEQLGLFRAFVAAAGLGAVDYVTEMYKGRRRGNDAASTIHALSWQSIG